jgi:hypothetical protein
MCTFLRPAVTSPDVRRVLKHLHSVVKADVLSQSKTEQCFKNSDVIPILRHSLKRVKSR